MSVYVCTYVSKQELRLLVDASQTLSSCARVSDTKGGRVVLKGSIQDEGELNGRASQEV